MTFVWPWMLLLLFAVPLLVGGYRGLLARRAARRRELGAVGLVAPARMSAGARRHVGPALFLSALVLLVVALARPEASIAQPRREGTVVLAFDVSSSMAATDVKPSRMEAAKAAARAFVDAQPAAIRIGVVAFGATGVVSQRPTDDRSAVLDAVDRMAPQGGTSLARGIETSLSAIADRPLAFDGDESGSALEPTGPDIGYYGSASVILLSDGESTEGPAVDSAAELASTAGVRIYPVGLGSAEGTVLKLDGFSVVTTLDEPALRGIATTTDGQYFSAAQVRDAAALARIYRSIDLAWAVHTEHIEITALFAAAAALLLGLGSVLSYSWFGRVI